MNKTLALTTLLAVIGLSACTTERVSNIPSYKLKVVQGNQLDPRAIASLRGGMSRDQVRQLLGTPMLRDAFHADQWDYTYEVSRNGKVKELRHLTLTFQNDQLANVEGNALEQAAQELKQRYGVDVQAAEPTAPEAAPQTPALWTPNQ